MMLDESKFGTSSLNEVERLVKGIEIQLKYADDRPSVAADHEIIYGPGGTEGVSDEDAVVLNELGWHVADEFECWAFFC